MLTWRNLDRILTKLYYNKQARTVGSRFRLLLAYRDVYKLQNAPIPYQHTQAGVGTITENAYRNTIKLVTEPTTLFVFKIYEKGTDHQVRKTVHDWAREKLGPAWKQKPYSAGPRSQQELNG